MLGLQQPKSGFESGVSSKLQMPQRWRRSKFFCLLPCLYLLFLSFQKVVAVWRRHVWTMSMKQDACLYWVFNKAICLSVCLPARESQLWEKARRRITRQVIGRGMVNTKNHCRNDVQRWHYVRNTTFIHERGRSGKEGMLNGERQSCMARFRQ